ncbi:acetoacetate decarboxylase family protein [Hydrocarboniphaga sp.]|uniref:acetoacetate decarboxylase family protein n=1 Tax=Hydrocarboniphaga sp. TaxID=2033016 RepID=UPI003D0E9542
MSFEFKPGVRYRMPAVFGPAPGPRQKPDGTPWLPAETGTMNCQWTTVYYRTDRAKMEKLLPPGFEIRGEPIVAVSLSHFKNLYWLAGRGYGILFVDFPVVYTGKSETISGHFCPVLWEGRPDAIMTGREELGFPKLFADMPDLKVDEATGAVSAEASWFDFKFFDISLNGLSEVQGDKTLPGNGGPAMFYKYMPRTGVGAGADVAYVTSSQPLPGMPLDAAPIKFGDANFRKWKAESGSVNWHRAKFEQLPTTFHVVNGMADLNIIEYVGAEMIEFSAPGIAVSATTMRPVDPA